ncbi:hypothetical protein PDIG_02650 [Penicillium digitatum PHI26]|uniref:Secreted protein n=2 Tax=Penicillium digitatum TaxID=36651 RepID=K9GXX4_PEND2|nr:hypothetical protein PDIP_13910 [Penicillium digitatum Pd1]EKV19468.1 hypothetical protein PDIG_02650 [Penicillium digitatum PHI26]EKV20675.1 hypothetical protein PDIP_13910 [Penicillium digitatum Pd1]
MWFLLGTVLTLLVIIDCAMAVCSTFSTQINVSMCSWQGLRGKHFLSIYFSKKTSSFVTETGSQYPARYNLLRRWGDMVPEV